MFPGRPRLMVEAKGVACMRTVAAQTRTDDSLTRYERCRPGALPAMSRGMMSRLGLWVAALFLTALPSGALGEPNLRAEDAATAGDPKLDAMPRSLEIRFALSALPALLRDKATVYV